MTQNQILDIANTPCKEDQFSMFTLVFSLYHPPLLKFRNIHWILNKYRYIFWLSVTHLLIYSFTTTETMQEGASNHKVWGHAHFSVLLFTFFLRKIPRITMKQCRYLILLWSLKILFYRTIAILSITSAIHNAWTPCPLCNPISCCLSVSVTFRTVLLLLFYYY